MSQAHPAAWAEGRTLSTDQVVALALAPEPDPNPEGAAGGEPSAGPAVEAADPANPAGLTPRERDVLRLLVEGKTDREIGDALFIGHRTVASHVSAILGKLMVESRTAAATKAVRQSLV